MRHIGLGTEEMILQNLIRTKSQKHQWQKIRVLAPATKQSSLLLPPFILFRPPVDRRMSSHLENWLLTPLTNSNINLFWKHLHRHTQFKLNKGTGSSWLLQWTHTITITEVFCYRRQKYWNGPDSSAVSLFPGQDEGTLVFLKVKQELRNILLKGIDSSFGLKCD